MGNRRFLGDVRAKTIGSAGDAIAPIVICIGEVGGSESPSPSFRQGPDGEDMDRGEGNGVMSTSGPTPGEETAEPGERELTLERVFANADLMLVLRTGRPALAIMFCDKSSR